MVQNKTGGNRTKGFARKNERATNTRLRMVECEEEKYAIVRKILGGTRCEVLCDDRVNRHAIIRGKFTGKNKRGNVIQAGTILLIGIRDWVTKKDDKMEECDVLEVYSALEMNQLKQRPTFPIEFIDTSIREMFGSSKAGAKADGFEFTNVEEPEVNTALTDTTVVMETGEEIDIEDI